MIIFSWAYACAVIFSQISHWEWLGLLRSAPFSANSLIETIVSASALFLILRPQSLFRLQILCISLLCNTIWFLPEVPNHRFVLTFVALAVMLASREQTESKELYERLKPSLWGISILLYFFAFFHKLTPDFINPETSCAVKFLGNIISGLGSHSVLTQLSIWGTLSFEGIIIFGLLFRATRKISVLLAITFHFVLSLDTEMHFLDFSATMCLLLLSFIDFKEFSKYSQLKLGKISASFISKFLFISFFVLIVFGLVFGASDSGYYHFLIVRQVAWSVYAISIFSLIFFRGDSGQLMISFCELKSTGIIVGFMLLNGFSPYLGLKTRTAFSMYSNLHVTETDSNHFIIPRSLDLLGLLEDRVTLIGPIDIKGGMIGAELPYVTFSYLVDSAKPKKIEYSYRGEVYHYPDQELPRKTSWILRKFTLFKPIGEPAKQACIW